MQPALGCGEPENCMERFLDQRCLLREKIICIELLLNYWNR